MKKYILRKSKTTNEPKKYLEQLEIEKELFRKEFLDKCLEQEGDFGTVITGHLVGIDGTDNTDTFELMATISTVDYSEIKIIKQVIAQLKSNSFDKDNIIQELEKLTLETVSLKYIHS